MGNTRSILLFWGKVANSTNIFGVQFPEKNVKRLLLPTQKKQDRGNIFQLLRLLLYTFVAKRFQLSRLFLHICCQHFSTFETSYRKEGEQTNCGGVIDCLGLNSIQKGKLNQFYKFFSKWQVKVNQDHNVVQKQICGSLRNISVCFSQRCKTWWQILLAKLVPINFR